MWASTCRASTSRERGPLCVGGRTMCMFSCMLCMLYGLPVFLNIVSVPIDCKSHLMFMCQLSEWMFSRCVALQCLLSNHPYACVFSFLMVTVTCCICLMKKCREASSRKGVRKLVALRRPSGRSIFQCRLCGKRRVSHDCGPVVQIAWDQRCLFLYHWKSERKDDLHCLA